MKRLLLIILFVFAVLMAMGQPFYDFEKIDLCWDSAGVKKVQIYSLNFHSINNTGNALLLGYYTKTGSRFVDPLENELTPGFCVAPDTLEHFLCVQNPFDRFLPDIGGEYEYGQVFKLFTRTVNGKVIERKLLHPVTLAVVDTTFTDRDFIACEEFASTDTRFLAWQSAPFTVTASDTIRIFPLGPIAEMFTQLEISCDPSQVQGLKIEYDFFPEYAINNNEIDEFGNAEEYLRPWRSSVSARTKFWRFKSFKVTNTGTEDCDCIYSAFTEFFRY